jgi:hypothetical protein
MSSNDGPSAQAATCRDLANMYALLNERQLIDQASSEAMLVLLADAQFGPDAEPSWVTRPEYAPFDMALTGTHTKIGVGPLKPENGGFDVVSEGSILHQIETGRKFIVVLQNSRFDDDSLRAMSFAINRSMKLFLGLP